MKDSSIAVSGRPDDFVAPDDEGLFAFVSTLRVSVKAKVAAEQQRGLPLSEIVDQVREMGGARRKRESSAKAAAGLDYNTVEVNRYYSQASAPVLIASRCCAVRGVGEDLNDRGRRQEGVGGVS